MNAWEKFKHFVTARSLVHPGDSVLLAVSGGPDSVCLLHLFWRLRKILPIELAAVTVDHGLRAKAPREIAAVRKLGERLSVPVIVKQAPVRSLAMRTRISLETAGRVLRYEAYAQAAEERGCTLVATGHTANDNAETLLMWLARGTGPDGLAGIPVRRKGENGLTVIRPMLPLTRRDVRAYLKGQKLSFCIDASNFELDYTRNRIRHTLVPVLEKFNPRAVEHLFALSQDIAAETGFLESQAEKALRRAAETAPNRILLDLKRFFRYNEVIQNRVLKRLLPENRSRANVERIAEWMRSRRKNALELSGSWTIRKTNNRLYFQKKDRRAHREKRA